MTDTTITSPISSPIMTDVLPQSPRPKTPHMDPRTAFYKLLGMDENSLPPPPSPGHPIKPMMVSIPSSAFNPYHNPAAPSSYFYPHHWYQQNSYVQPPFLYRNPSSDTSSSGSSSPETPSRPLITATASTKVKPTSNGRYNFIRSPEDLDAATVDILCSSSILDQRVVYDVRFNVRNTIRSSSGKQLGTREMAWPAVNPARNRILLICADLPWSIEIKAHSRNTQGVTCGEVLNGIAEALDKEVLYSEKFICRAEKRKLLVETQKQNLDAGCGVTGKRKEDDETRRVDWLGAKTVFRGITRPHTDEHHELVKQRVHERDLGHAWILELDDQANP